MTEILIKGEQSMEVKDILAKVTFVVLIVIFIFFVMFGKEFMAVINGLIETESLMDQLLR